MLDLKNLAFSVEEDAGQKDILRDVSLTVPDGAFWGPRNPGAAAEAVLPAAAATKSKIY